MNFIEELEKNGYCIIPNIISKYECSKNISEIWNWLENLNSGINRNDENTWSDDYWPPNTNGILQQFGVSHLQFIWDLRSNENIINIFKQIWNTYDLEVSFDGINIIRPKKFINNIEEWFHIDQGSCKKGLHCVQGFINLEDTNDDDASLLVYDKSHLFHEKIFENNKKIIKHDYYHIDEEDTYVIKDLKKIKIVAPKGSLILWDSRTIHCNCSPTHDINKFRYVVYICMTPSNLSNNDNRLKKKRALENLLSTTHWPHDVKFKQQIGTKNELKKFKPILIKPKLSKKAFELSGILKIN